MVESVASNLCRSIAVESLNQTEDLEKVTCNAHGRYITTGAVVGLAHFYQSFSTVTLTQRPG